MLHLQKYSIPEKLWIILELFKFLHLKNVKNWVIFYVYVYIP